LFGWGEAGDVVEVVLVTVSKCRCHWCDFPNAFFRVAFAVMHMHGF
jgi:hypothetical protein